MSGRCREPAETRKGTSTGDETRSTTAAHEQIWAHFDEFAILDEGGRTRVSFPERHSPTVVSSRQRSK